MVELLTSQEVADQLKVKIETVYLWINAGRLKAVKAGDLWRVYQTDLDEFLQAGKTIGKGE